MYKNVSHDRNVRMSLASVAAAAVCDGTYAVAWVDARPIPSVGNGFAAVWGLDLACKGLGRQR